MKRLKYLLLMVPLLVVGCTPTAYYYKAVEAANNQQIAIAKAAVAAEAERYRALAEIAREGGETSKTMAVMAIVMGGQRATPQVAVPQPVKSEALQWASLVTQPLTMGLVGYFGMRTQMNASDNALKATVSSNQTFAGMAGAIGSSAVAGYPYIQAPAASVTTTTSNVDSSTHSSVGDYSGSGSGTSDSSTHSSVGDFSGANSGNSGRLAGGDVMDSTHTPTVVLPDNNTVVVTPIDFTVTR